MSVEGVALRVLFLILILIWSVQGHAALDFEDATFPEFVTSARALAMGNAYLNKVDDSWSAFYNPAGLGTVRKPQFHIANLHIEMSRGYMETNFGGAFIDGFGNAMDSFDAQALRENLAEDKNRGKLNHLRLNLFPNITFRGMTLGYMISQRNRAIIEEEADSPFELIERRDHGPVFALNMSLFGGVFKVGASAVYLIRRELDLEIGPSDTLEIGDDTYSKGKGVYLTMGSRLTLPFVFLPTFSFVVRNSADKNWEDIEGAGAPQKIEQTMDAAFSLTPQIGKVVRVHLEANWRDIHNAYETNIRRRLGVGMEIDYKRMIFLRAGYGDGWGSAGIGVRNRTFIFDLSTYAVDRSLDGYRQEEDRRFVLSLSSGF